MKLNDYLKLSYRMEIVEDREEGGYVVSFPELKGCISTGDTIIEAIESAKDAKKAWLEAAIEDNYPIPLPDGNEKYSGQFKFRMPKTLHRQLAEHAKQEGISMNQYCLYLLTKYDTAFSNSKT